MLLARLNDQMTDIRRLLSASPFVRTASTWRDLTTTRDSMEPDGEYAVFDTCVEVETRGGEALVWSVEIRLTSKSWRLHRDISKVEEYGAQTIMSFEGATFDRFAEMEERVPALVDEFVEFARTFDFTLKA